MTHVQGTVAEGFHAVRQAFERNFTEGGEVGAGLTVYRHGRPVVDLWGGHADPETRRPWRRDTIAPIASTCKSFATGAVLLLVERGQVDLEAPVARYWPEFARHGKDEITVRTLLGHRAGLPSMHMRPITWEDLRDWTPITDALAAAVPEWPPGAAHGYHGVTIGHLAGEIVRRVSGMTLSEFLTREITGPLGLDCYVRVPDEAMPRLAAMVLPDADSLRLGMEVPELADFVRALDDPGGLPYRALYGSVALDWEAAADPLTYRVESPSMDGVASAHSLARYFAALTGEVDGVRLLDPGLVDRIRTPQAEGVDRILRVHTAWGIGFAVPGGPFWPAPDHLTGLFGHSGATGSFAFADPDRGLAFGYVPNRGSELLEGGDFRVRSLTEALYASLPDE
ncbi:serine hydrolase domain-containing protein [Actinomadura kijaniata]|uniref:CubicO group peptidase (Beta-lactamase class C family) n=1 Tax=Actinomadura namibiensis TaxID=182080 RepID=A0A7W3LNZ5_ACTNM|nr:serine hydrolase domain-containing protein [Actinomadura namibiensis]MBA8951620.1 CubicO group peptidase (beta-lactamase class C family) [Actinomadura namibiensis]